MRPALLRNWTLAGTASGLLGMAMVGAAATLVAVLSPRLEAMALLAWALVPATALGVGLILGLAQWLAAREVIPELDGWSWVGATLLSTMVAALVTMAAANRLPTERVEMSFLFGVALAMGAAAGALVGLFQTLVLRHHLPAGSSWVAINMLAWVASFGVGFIGLGLATTLEAGPRTLIALATGLVAGTVVGLITGPLLLVLVRQAGLLPGERTQQGRPRATGHFTPMLAKDGMTG